MVRDKIENGDLKITHHQNVRASGESHTNDAAFIDDNHNRIFTIVPHRSTSVSNNLSAVKAASGQQARGSLPTSSSAPSLRQPNLNKIGQANQKYRRRTYRHRPIIIIPLVLTGMLVVIGLAGFTVIAVVSSSRNSARDNSTGRPEQLQHHKEYFQDFSFLAKNASPSSVSASTSTRSSATATTSTQEEEILIESPALPSDRNENTKLLLKIKPLPHLACKCFFFLDASSIIYYF
jgi:hypothetical protein